MSIASSIFKFSISTWINFIVSSCAVFLLTRIFLPSEYAVISLFATATEFGMSIFCMGMDSACLRFYNNPPNEDPRNLFIGKIILFCSALILLAFPVFLLNPQQMSALMFGKSGFILVFLLLANIYSSILFRFFSISYRMEMKTKSYNIQMILTNTIKRIGFILAVFISPDAETAISIQVTLLLITLCFYTYKQHGEIFPTLTDLKKIRFSTFFKGYKSFLKFSIFSAPNYWLIYANNYFCLLLIGHYCGATSVGIFSTAIFFSTALAVMRGGFVTFWGPFIYTNYQTKQDVIVRVHGIFVLFSAVCYSLILIFKDLLYLFIGPEYILGKTILPYVLLSSLLQSFLETTVYGIYIEKKAHIVTIILVIQLLSNISLLLILTPIYGIMGGAISMLVSNLLYFTLSTYYGQLYYRSIKNGIYTAISIFCLIAECILINLTSSILLWILICTLPILVIGYIYRHDVTLIAGYVKCLLNKQKESRIIKRC